MTARRARSRTSGRLCALIALVSLLCSFAVSLGRPVAATTARTAQVTPATGLTDQVAEVSWRGFDPTRTDG
ncbi:MAG: hypothetical protein M3Q30_24900, partial [Actinomycetota bacterium]|nr:hypothetical protein [Actinomycetota bacterium]